METCQFVDLARERMSGTDATPTVVEAFKNKLPIKRVFEPEPGKSNALNVAIDSGAGKYFIWTDDDVLFAPNWLVAYLEAFKRWPNAAIFAGKIIPVHQSPTPTWRAPLPGVTLVHDLAHLPLPFSAGRLDRILCQDVLEHVDIVSTMRELHRLLSLGGILEIRVPHFTSAQTYTDATHLRGFSI
jgi:glycosyltransferase involved in cell wall biosynthesis